MRLRRYQEEILSGEMRPDETYNYGHRLRNYFGLDTLAACVERLQHDPEDRKSYVTLWDNTRDLGQVEGRPCLVSLYFRKFENKLTLSATFRTHNAMDAYPMNLYGLHGHPGAGWRNGPGCCPAPWWSSAIPWVWTPKNWTGPC